MPATSLTPPNPHDPGPPPPQQDQHRTSTTNTCPSPASHCSRGGLRVRTQRTRGGQRQGKDEATMMGGDNTPPPMPLRHHDTPPAPSLASNCSWGGWWVEPRWGGETRQWTNAATSPQHITVPPYLWGGPTMWRSDNSDDDDAA